MCALTDIIARLEKCVGSDHKLDLEIERHKVGPEWEIYIKPFIPALLEPAKAMMRKAGTDDEGAHVRIPEYTASVDSALTLLPDWASYELTRSAAGEPTFTRCRLWDWRRSPLALDPHNEWKSEDGNRPLPINIVIAALKARTA